MLVNTGEVRTWLGIKVADSNPNQKIEDLINAVEDFADNYTMRGLEARTYDGDVQFSILDGKGHSWIYLPQFPVSNITEVFVDADREFGAGSEIDAGDFYFYPSGKLVSSVGRFLQGRRNVKVTYIAGYSPVHGGTHNALTGSYPAPYDLKQAIVEMVGLSFREGATLIHNVTDENDNSIKFQQILSNNSYIKRTLDKYIRHDAGMEFVGE